MAPNGTITVTPIMARMTHAILQPTASMSICVSGTNRSAPTGMPRDIYARARPLSLTNHLSTGTDVISAPGPLIPTKPMTAKSTMRCHAYCMLARPIIARPVARAANESMAREPKRSSSGPMIGLDSAPAPCRAVCAHPNAARPMPSSSPIGLMNRPKLSDPIAMLTAPDAPIMATIIQP